MTSRNLGDSEVSNQNCSDLGTQFHSETFVESVGFHEGMKRAGKLEQAEMP